MAMDARAEEILETLWRRTVEEAKPSVALEELGLGRGDAGLEELLRQELVSLAAVGGLGLTEAGRSEARHVVRCHRLAERLLADVLDVSEPLADESACQFEHLLRREVEEKVCILLGHPASCPHGKPIPAGNCCRVERRDELRQVRPLTGLKPGQEGTVAWLQGGDARRMQKLMAMGILPGTPIRLIRRFPSYIFQMSYSRFAVDQEMAAGIYVRLEPEPRVPEPRVP